MPSSYVTYAAFFLVCLVLLTLPFVPAFREWRHPTDSAALPVSPDYASDVDHFARRLHADVVARLVLKAQAGSEDFDFVTYPVQAMDLGGARKRLISRRSIETAAPVRSVQALYVEGSLRAGAESSFSALYATGDIELAAESEIHDWAHAGGVVRLGRHSIALRRISAGTAIELGDEAWFERLQAPILRFGSRISPVAPRDEVEQASASLSELPHAIQQTPSLFFIRGDCALAPDRIYLGSLVVTGFLTIGARTTVIGDIKARKGVSIGHRASVQGAVTCEQRVYVFKNAQVFGPVISESDVLIGQSAVIGQLDANTTVSARNIIVEDGVVVHGAIWAHEVGMVKAA